jgi:hypothetical protein
MCVRGGEVGWLHTSTRLHPLRSNFARWHRTALGRFLTFETRPKLEGALQTLSCLLLENGFTLAYGGFSGSAVLIKTKERPAFLYRNIFKAIDEFTTQRFTVSCASPAAKSTRILPVTSACLTAYTIWNE